MAPIDIKAHLVERIDGASRYYVKDLAALPEALISESLGGTARTPADFTYEVIFVNQRVAKRLRGEEPEPFDPQGWMVAPDNMRSKEALTRALVESTTAVLEALQAIPDGELMNPIDSPSGETNAIKLASLVATHLTYHDAQLNYIQSLNGDDDMHWGE